MNLARAGLAFTQARLAASSPAFLNWIAHRRLKRNGFSEFDLASAPIVTPQDYRAHFEKWNALGLSINVARAMADKEMAGEPTGHGEISFGLSTGTSGNSGVFMTTAADRDRYFGFFMARVLPKGLLFGTKAAVLLRHDNAIYHDGGKRVTFLTLKEKPNDIALRLLAVKPDILVGPPSALLKLAETRVLENEPLRPRLIIAGGEPLWPDDFVRLKLRYAAEIREVYQTCEGFIGASCVHGRLHLNTDIVHMHRLPIAPRRFIPVITDIARSGVQKIVRLSMDDVAVVSEDICPCGSALPFISHVEGRLADVFVIDEKLIFPSEVVAAAHAPVPYEIVQIGPHALAIRLAPDDAGDFPAMERALKALVEGKGVKAPHISHTPLSNRPLWEKARRVQRVIDPDNAELRRLILRDVREPSPLI